MPTKSGAYSKEQPLNRKPSPGSNPPQRRSDPPVRGVDPEEDILRGDGKGHSQPLPKR